MNNNSGAKSATVGELVTKHRLAQGRSARNVARDAGIDISTMTKVERGFYASPSPLTLRAISKALSIPLLDLFSAAGYVTPYDLVELVTTPTADQMLSDQAALDARDRYIAELIDKHGLEYNEPGVTYDPDISN